MYPNIYLGYTNNANTQLFYSCNLQPGHTYYLNMRSNYDATSGTYLPAGYLISSQSR